VVNALQLSLDVSCARDDDISYFESTCMSQSLRMIAPSVLVLSCSTITRYVARSDCD